MPCCIGCKFSDVVGVDLRARELFAEPRADRVEVGLRA
jgi:hypothetical protein